YVHGRGPTGVKRERAPIDGQRRTGEVAGWQRRVAAAGGRWWREPARRLERRERRVARAGQSPQPLRGVVLAQHRTGARITSGEVIVRRHGQRPAGGL